MTRIARIAQPWNHYTGAYAAPTSLLVRLKLGEVPDHIPTAMDVRQGARTRAERTGHGAVDRVSGAFGGSVRVSRLHSAAAALGRPGARNKGYSDLEVLTGISRMLRLDVEPGTHVGSMAISLRQLDVVESVTPNYIVAVGLDRYEPAFGGLGGDDEEDDDGWAPREMIGAQRALAHEPGDPAVIVGVVDSGVNPAHEEFGWRLRSGFDTVQLGHGEMAGGIALLGDNAGADVDPSDRFVGHGSGCAAIIGAAGERMPPGLAGDCQILPIRSLGAALFPGKQQAVGVGSVSDLDIGMVMAVQLGAKVVNLSFGTDDEAIEPGAPKPHAEAVAYATARGCTLVAAAGNSGDARTYWPAACPEVIAVGSVGLDAAASGFSTSGDHVALCAPGERIRTAAVDGYQRATGTSFAAPFAAAAAALLHSRAQRRSAALAPETVKQLLIESARPHRPDTPEGNGAGILDAARALALLDQALDADPSTEFGGPDDG
ncbi:S8 family serine peptidase [Altererythrobacter soli]|uniref:S8 family serine peptidase n=1 Tax=Croceibacterium soli TaxID=1739690 RepID=A0A6I4USI7_9SPHN|nr:S8 family serine peptidase [Croceibacterium soli]MXP40724.1 S8 family serine peptidase [Croceibacterium soli]